MTYLGASTLDVLKQDLDAREELIRNVVRDARAQLPPTDLTDHVVATYFVAARTMSAEQVGREICYHMTTSARTPAPGSLLHECTGQVAGAVPFEASGRTGVVRVAFPLKMLLDARGNLYSTSLLHIAAGAGVLALTEHADIKLVHLALSEQVMRLFPGPAYGAPGVRQLTGLAEGEAAFGTILKPCTGIRPQEEAEILAESAANPLFMFIKEDENFLPGVSFAPLVERVKCALDAIRSVADARAGKGLIFAPHVTSPPHLLADAVMSVVEAGVNGIMFSEYYAGGSTRLVRELTGTLTTPPVVYGHNGGISCRTRHIYREVLDLLARLDGIDFRQTAPLTSGPALLRPGGLEWRQCEEVLARPLAGHPPVMITRAGGLDQGNIIANLLDVSRGAGIGNYLFLAGSAINSIKNSEGRPDPALGAQAMSEALQLFHDGVFTDPDAISPAALKSYADEHGLKALGVSLSQRYRL